MEMNENLNLYEQARPVPSEAVKPIEAGRLKGFSDINPMWRIKRLTEMFGPCGLGWWYEIVSQRLEPTASGECFAFVDVNLYYEWNGKVSKPVPGIGGSSFIANQKSGLYASDECFKMALTDAISVAAKAIGVAADIYYAKDRDKYTALNAEQERKPEQKPEDRSAKKATACSMCGKEITAVKFKNGKTRSAENLIDSTTAKYGRPYCYTCAVGIANGNQ